MSYLLNVCRFDKAHALKGNRFGESSGRQLLTQMKCQGHERDLFECDTDKSVGYSICKQDLGAGVRCSNESAPT